MGGLGGTLGVIVRNLRTMKVVYWFNVSESSGADSRGLSLAKGIKRLLLVLNAE